MTETQKVITDLIAQFTREINKLASESSVDRHKFETNLANSQRIYETVESKVNELMSAIISIETLKEGFEQYKEFVSKHSETIIKEIENYVGTSEFDKRILATIMSLILDTNKLDENLKTKTVETIKSEAVREIFKIMIIESYKTEEAEIFTDGRIDKKLESKEFSGAIAKEIIVSHKEESTRKFVKSIIQEENSRILLGLLKKPYVWIGGVIGIIIISSLKDLAIG